MMMASVRDVGARGRDGVYERVTKLASVLFFKEQICSSSPGVVTPFSDSLARTEGCLRCHPLLV